MPIHLLLIVLLHNVPPRIVGSVAKRDASNGQEIGEGHRRPEEEEGEHLPFTDCDHVFDSPRSGPFSLPVFPREANADSSALFPPDENAAAHDEDPYGIYERVPSSTWQPFVTATAAAKETEGKGETETAVARYQSLPENIQCIYTFVAQPRERVKLHIEHFQLEGTSNHCESEYVDVYSELGSPSEDLLSSNLGARYCGTVAPNVQISLHNVIVLVLHSRVGRQRTGGQPFALGGTFEFISEAPFLPGPALPGGPKGCAFLVEPSDGRNDGTILSPTYPGTYPSNLHCLYLLRGEPSQRVRLFFRDFDVYFGGEHCPYDSLTVYDGSSTSDPIIRKLCGLQQRLELFSFGHQLLLEFNTTEVEGKLGDRGFFVEYQFSDTFVNIRRLIGAKPSVHCPSHLRGSECDLRVCSNHESVHFVHSPNFPDIYPPNTTCTYIVDGLQGDQNLEKVLLRFETFVVPGQSALNLDENGSKPPANKFHLQLDASPRPNSFPQKCSSSGSFVGIGTTPSIIKSMLANAEESVYDAILCDRIAEGTLNFVSQGPRIVMVFSSSEQQPLIGNLGPPPYGFRARVEFKTDFGIAGESIGGSNRCAFRFRDSSGSFNSPRYPANYPLDAECTYHIVGSPDAQILLYFKQFALFEENSMEQCNDWLRIFDVFQSPNGGETLKLQAKHCWHVFPGPTVSALGSREMRVVFHSDNFGTANGFDARYEIRPAATKKVSDAKDCKEGSPSTALIQSDDQRTSGHFASPGFPVKYTKNLTCDLEIRVREGHQVLLKANMFNVEGQMTDEKVDCMSAVLRVHLDMNNRSGSDLQLCGESVNLIPAIVSSSNSIRLSFLTSPEKVNGLNGFNFSWTEVRRVISDGECSDSERHYLCSYSRLCIDAKLRCNGEENCGENDDSDEAHCSRIEALASPTTIVVAYIVSGVIFLFILSLFCFLFKSKLERKSYKKAEEKRNRQQKENRKKAKRRRQRYRRAGEQRQSPRQPYRQPRPRKTVSDAHKLSGIYGGVGTPMVMLVRGPMERMLEEGGDNDAPGHGQRQETGDGLGRRWTACNTVHTLFSVHQQHNHQSHSQQIPAASVDEPTIGQNDANTTESEEGNENNVRVFYG
uniref:CUB domain-containing protein n=1 Tax=Globodera pallida TaxID=36090 RepID=A0A183BT09_GLOPA